MNEIENQRQVGKGRLVDFQTNVRESGSFTPTSLKTLQRSAYTTWVDLEAKDRMMKRISAHGE